MLFGANDVTRTHDLLITNQLLYRLSYISLSIHDMVFLERHIQNRIYFIIFFDGRQQILLISCHTLCMAIPVYYILYFEGIPSKYFQAISLFPTLFPRIPPITTGNSVVIFPRNFDKFCHYFLLTPFFLQSSVLFSIYIIYYNFFLQRVIHIFHMIFHTRIFYLFSIFFCKLYKFTIFSFCAFPPPKKASKLYIMFCLQKLLRLSCLFFQK